VKGSVHCGSAPRFLSQLPRFEARLRVLAAVSFKHLRHHRQRGVHVQPQTAHSDTQTFAALVHLSGIFTLFFGPLVVYLARPSRDDVLALAAKEALNFQLTLALAWVVTFISLLLLIGFLLVPFLALVSVAVPVWAAVATSRGECFRYPLIVRWLR